MKLTGENRSTGGKTYRSATLSTTNPTWTDPGSNPTVLVSILSGQGWYTEWHLTHSVMLTMY
jgi:hypothetical protein